MKMAKKCPSCGTKGRNYPKQPRGYVEWQNWAEKMSKTHRQLACPGCGLLTVWVLKARGRLS